MLIATITTQRSGSKLLGNCFGSGTQVRPHGELFNPDSTATWSFPQFVSTFGYAEMLRLGSEAALDKYFSELLATWGHIQFDLMFNQLEASCLSWNSYHTYFVYGYLKSRRAIVISLERTLRDSYLSAKYLEVSHHPHNYARGETAPQLQGLTIDFDDYRRFAATIGTHQKLLREEMSSYEYFVRLNYSQLSKIGAIPKDVISLIKRRADEGREPLVAQFVQMHNPALQPTRVDYSEAFVNYAEFEALTAQS